jgi:hypothetical protein
MIAVLRACQIIESDGAWHTHLGFGIGGNDVYQDGESVVSARCV